MLYLLFALFTAVSGCTESQLDRCRKRMSATCASLALDPSQCVPGCAGGDTPLFVKEECCFSCVPTTGFDTCLSTPLLGKAPTALSLDQNGNVVYDWSKTCRLTFCRSDETPTKKTNCCQSCLPLKPACTFEQKTACASKDVPECGLLEFPVSIDCCESCRPPAPKVCSFSKDAWLALPACANGEEPQLDANYCPNCVKPVETQPTCTVTDFTNCPAINTCAAGVLPERDPDNRCCMTCKAPLQDCTKEKVEACRSSYETLPECASLTEATSRDNFDTTTCCPKCRAPAPSAEAEKPDSDGRCTYDAFRLCMESKPVCASPDEFFVDKVSCCGTCQRPERRAAVEQAAQCLAQRPVCDANQRPVAVADEACFSCRKPVPCSRNDCADTEVCYKDQCVAKKRVMIKVHVTTEAIKDRLAALKDQPELAAELVKESLRRYCENQDFVRRQVCARIARSLYTLAVEADSAEWNDGEAKLTLWLQFAEANQDGSARRLLSSDNEGEVIVQAMSDQDSGIAGVTVTWGDGPLDAACTSLPSFLVAAFALLACLWA